MTQWINDPQEREEIEKVTKELKLPVWKANYKGKFRDFWNELWDKIEDGYLRLKENIAGKEPTILKKSGFNLDKTDSFEEDDTNKLATAKALKKLNDNVSNHSHDDRYYTETEIDNKLSEDIFHNTGKEYGGILNYSGNKIAGKTYFDNNTKKLFLCLKNNNNTSANTENFIPLDNNSLLDRLENLSTFKVQVLYSTPAGVKFTIFQYGNLLMINAHTHNIEKILYGVSYICNLPYNCYNTATAITGNNGSSGHFTLDNNILAVNSTDSKLELINTFMGQLTTFLK